MQSRNGCELIGSMSFYRISENANKNMVEEQIILSIPRHHLFHNSFLSDSIRGPPAIRHQGSETSECR